MREKQRQDDYNTQFKDYDKKRNVLKKMAHEMKRERQMGGEMYGSDSEKGYPYRIESQGASAQGELEGMSQMVDY